MGWMYGHEETEDFSFFFPPTPTPGCGQTSDFVSLLNFFL